MTRINTTAMCREVARKAEAAQQYARAARWYRAAIAVYPAACALTKACGQESLRDRDIAALAERAR